MLDINGEHLTIATPEGTEIFDHLDGRYKSESIDIFLKAWEGSNYTKLRSTTEDIILKHPLINFCLFTQPSELEKLKKHEGRGLYQRFLFSFPERYPLEKIKLYKKIDKQIEEDFNTKLKLLFEYQNGKKQGEKQKVIVSQQALGKFEELYLKILKESYKKDLSVTTQQWLLKVFGNLLKIVSLLKVADVIANNEDIRCISLDQSDFIKLDKLYQYYYEHFKKANQTAETRTKESDLEYCYKRILELDKKIKNNGKLSSTEINNNIKRFDKKEREKLLTILEDNNLIKVIHDGRKTTIFINPKLKKRPYEEALKFVRLN